ncbi:MAG: (d)CMP kinase [Candidatus Omnitrophota bacterium]
MIIAIDGPAGAGKSTVAKIIAQKLGFLYIDTGAMYRALTLKVLGENIPLSETGEIIQAARSSRIELKNNSGSLLVFLDGRDVSREIRQPKITQFVSDIAKIKEVREEMLKLQRKMGRESNSVLDGRDIGTVVFPDAGKKFYIDAKFPERAKRRYEELKGLGEDVTLEEIEKDLKNRDTIDSSREFAPLKKADDAIYIDTTDLTIEEVVDRVLKDIGPQDKWTNL